MLVLKHFCTNKKNNKLICKLLPLNLSLMLAYNEYLQYNIKLYFHSEHIMYVYINIFCCKVYFVPNLHYTYNTTQLLTTLQNIGTEVAEETGRDSLIRDFKQNGRENLLFLFRKENNNHKKKSITNLLAFRSLFLFSTFQN